MQYVIYTPDCSPGAFIRQCNMFCVMYLSIWILIFDLKSYPNHVVCVHSSTMNRQQTSPKIKSIKYVFIKSYFYKVPVKIESWRAIWCLCLLKFKNFRWLSTYNISIWALRLFPDRLLSNRLFSDRTYPGYKQLTQPFHRCLH